MEHDRTDPCAVCLAQAVEKAAQEKEPELIKEIEPIVWQNWDSGRASKFIDEVNVERCEEYVKRIADTYLKWHNRVYRLRVEKDPAEWQDFFTQLQRWAYSFLRKKSFPAYGEGRKRHAVDCATEAAARVLSARFPYDVDFSCWAYVLLQNTCLSHMRRHIQTTSVPYHREVEFGDSTEHQASEEENDEIQQFDRAQDLEQRIKKLSSEKQRFVQLFYFEEKGYQEIAAIMGCSINALYKVHYDALKGLGRKPGKSRNSNE
jgi:RNA polymerase sigma-70 factor, ECF subfamily